MDSTFSPLRGSDVRQQNEKLVLNYFYDKQLTSQAEISVKTGLKPSTVLRIFANLVQRGEIRLASAEEPANGGQPRNGKLGRPAAYYELCENAHHVVGISFTEDAIYCTIVNFTLHVVYRCSSEWTFPQTGDELCEQIGGFLAGALADGGIPADSVIGVGLGCPSAIGPNGVLTKTTFRSPISDFPIAAKLAERFPIPFFAQNNTVLAAQNMHRYGECEAFEHILVLSLEQTMPLVNFTHSLRCGSGDSSVFPVGGICQSFYAAIKKETLSSIAEERAILRRVRQLTGIGELSGVCQALDGENRIVQDLLADVVNPLALCIRNAISTFEPDCFVLLSGSKAFSEFLLRRAAASGIMNLETAVPLIAAENNPYYIARSSTDLVYDWFFNAGLPWRRPDTTPEDRLV